MRYKIVEVAGDFYYEEMSEEEFIRKGLIYNKEGQLKNQRDIDLFCQDNLNEKLPLDGPLWRSYLQTYNFNGKEIFFIIWKSHHSFCDGISIMSLSLAMSHEYDRSYFVKS